jgi:DNA-binding response OmpR family regulator
MMPDISGKETLQRSAQEFGASDHADRERRGRRTGGGPGVGGRRLYRKPYYARELLAGSMLSCAARAGICSPRLAAGKLRLFPENTRSHSMVEAGSQHSNSTCWKHCCAAEPQSPPKTNCPERIGRRREQYDRSVDVHVSNLRRKLALVSNMAIASKRSAPWVIA